MDSPKILIVDDNVELCNTFKEVLEEEGYTVSTANNGKQGLAQAKKTRFDLVITDKNMPEMGGLRLLKSLRKIDPDVKVILITAFGGKQSHIGAMESGAIEFLNKPLSVKDLKDFVSNLIKSH